MSGNNCLSAVLAAFGLLASVSAVIAAPLITEGAFGVVDWSSGEARVVGVGTPRLLSTTGGLTDADLREMAQKDAESRLTRAMLALPVSPQRTLARLPQWAAKVRQSVRRFRTQAIRSGSDGTIHLDARLTFEHLFSVVKPARATPGGQRDAQVPVLRLRIGQAIEPCMRVVVRFGDEAPVLFGLPESPDVTGRPVDWRVSDGDATMVEGLPAEVSQPSDAALVLRIQVPAEQPAGTTALLREAQRLEVWLPPEKSP